VTLRFLRLAVLAAVAAGALPSLAADEEPRPPRLPVVWEAPDALRVLYERHLPPPAEATQDRGAWRRWFRDVRARAPGIAAAEGWVSATVDIREEQDRTRVVLTPGSRAVVAGIDIQFRGDIAGEGEWRAQRRESLRTGWQLAAGQPFRQAAWDDAKARVLEALTSDDYATGEIVASEARVDANAAQARLSITLDSGPAFTLGEPVVTGIERYPRHLVDRLLDIDPGEPYRSDRLLDVQRRLQSTPWFASVTVDIDRDRAHPGRAPVRIAVTERPRADVGLAAGYGTDAGPRGEVSLRYRNALGRGYDMQSALQAERTRQIGYADFYLPPRGPGESVLGGQPARDSVGVLGERTANQGLETRRGAVAARRLVPLGPLEFGAGLGFQVEQSLPDGADPRVSRALTPNAHVTWRTVDDVLNPRRGGVLTVEATGAARSVLSDQTFLRGRAQYQHWFSLTQSSQLILRAEAGVVWAASREGIPEDFLFRAGGTRSVRGYAYQSLGVREGDAIVGGRYLATGTVEYVRWLSGDWGAALFWDAGDAADRRADLTLNQGYGVGARWRTAAGPIAADLGWSERDRKARLSLSVSVAF